MVREPCAGPGPRPTPAFGRPHHGSGRPRGLSLQPVIEEHASKGFSKTMLSGFHRKGGVCLFRTRGGGGERDGGRGGDCRGDPGGLQARPGCHF